MTLPYDGRRVNNYDNKFDETGHHFSILTYWVDDDIWVDSNVFWGDTYGCNQVSDIDKCHAFICELPWEDANDRDGSKMQFSDGSNYFGFRYGSYEYLVWYFPEGVDDEGRTPMEVSEQDLVEPYTEFIVSEDNKFAVWYIADNLENAQRILYSCKEYNVDFYGFVYNDMCTSMSY